MAKKTDKKSSVNDETTPPSPSRAPAPEIPAPHVPSPTAQTCANTEPRIRSPNPEIQLEGQPLPPQTSSEETSHRCSTPAWSMDCRAALEWHKQHDRYLRPTSGGSFRYLTHLMLPVHMFFDAIVLLMNNPKPEIGRSHSYGDELTAWDNDGDTRGDADSATDQQSSNESGSDGGEWADDQLEEFWTGLLPWNITPQDFDDGWPDANPDAIQTPGNVNTDVDNAQSWGNRDKRNPKWKRDAV
ncbi:hypothetical protein MIND_01135800 [Mycena indigotica]|uniref:Uncharacterized protein n=1 Tax=Mycena indigotica TaxID=2126181 RepID=A0A8H6S5N8_9AGAR|nr:uncharacterized protein MIND_01135800 [Mycena indigotica]KAF7293570.1 hypothetical protein MIND_01135800 [Mycena indigotica]